MESHCTAPHRRGLNREWTIVLSVLGVSLLIKLIYLVFYAQRVPFYSTPLGDSAVYLDWARSIARGDVLGSAEQYRVFYRAPLYPYILALFLKISASSLLPIYVAQLLLGTVNLLLAYSLAKRIFSHGAGLVAVVLGALHAPLAFKETKIVSVTLTITLTLLAAWMLLRANGRRPGPSWFLAGVFTGLATLTWGGSIVMLPVLFILWLLLKPRPKFALVALLGVGWFVAILPATLHNVLVGNDWVLVSSNSGYTFYQGNNAASSGTIVHPPEVYEPEVARTYGGRFPTGIADQQGFDLGYASRALKPPQQGKEQEVVKPSEASGFWLRRAFGWVGRNPGAFLRLEFQKLVLSLTNYEFPSNYFFSVEQYYVPVLRLLFMPFALILALAVLGIAVEFRSRARGWPLYLLVLSTVAVLLIFYAGSRYRLPLVLPLAVFAGAGAVRVYDRMRNRRLPLGELAVIGFVLVLSWIFCGVPLAKRFAFTSALGFRNVGEAWLTAGAGRPSTAPRGRAAFTKALSIFEQNDQFDLTPLSANALSEIYTLRGETYAAEAKYDSAIIDYRAAQAADTRASRPTSRLAVTFYIRGVSQRPADSAVAHACLDTALFYIADWRRFDTTALEPSALEGDVQLARGDTARALAKYGELTAAVPRFEPAYRAIGTILLARGDTTKAVANYDRLLAADSNNVFANLMLGDIAAARHDTARAFFRYERAATLDTLALLPPRQLAVLHSARGSHSEAAGVLTRIIGRIERTVDLRNGILGSPPDAALYLEMKLRLALAFMNLNQWENAVAQTGEVLALNPGLATARQLADAAKQKVIPKFILW